MDEPSNVTLVVGATVGFAVGLLAGIAVQGILYGASIGFALAVVSVAALMGRRQQ